MVKHPKKVVGYVRVSVDNDDKISPEIQAEQITRHCAAKGWELVDTLVERGKSAGEGKKRPKLDAARRMIRNGQASALVVAKMDRCSRSTRDFANLLYELQEHRADFVSTSEEFDTSTATGKAMVTITMAFAQLERDRGSERVTDWHRHRTRNGTPPPNLPLGYKRVDGRVVVDQFEARLVRRGVEVLLDTGSLAEVQRLWASRGVVKHPTTIRQTLMSPTLAGVRRMDGTRDEKGRRKVEAAPDAAFVRGDWPPIIPLPQHRQVLDLLGGRTTGIPPAPRKLLTSIATCGVDGHTLGSAARAAGRAAPYRCTKPGCGLSISQADLDRHVTDRLLAYVTPEMWSRIRDGHPAQPAVDTVVLERKLTELAEDWAHDRITTAERDTARSVLMAKVAEAEEVAENDLPDVKDLHGAWDGLTVEAQRLVVSAFVDRIVIGRGRPGRDPDRVKMAARVDIRWR